MHPLGYYFGISKQTEVILLTLVGICYTIFDPALLDLHSNLQKLWQIALDPTKITPKLQIYIKYILSLIVLVRTFSVHIYLAFYIVMLWPAFLEERPALLLPWLIVGAIKCLGMGVLAFVSGIYVCYAYGIKESICFDFILAQTIDYAPSFYMWYSVYSFYCDLRKSTITSTTDHRSVDIETQIALRRRKVRTLAEDLSVKNGYTIDEERNLISVSTIEDIVQHLTLNINRKTPRSFDSLLLAMAVEAEKEEVMNSCADPFNETVGLSLREKTMHLLKLSEADVIEAKERVKQHFQLFTNSMLNICNEGISKTNSLAIEETIPSDSKTLSVIDKVKRKPKVVPLHKRKQIELPTVNSRNESETQIGCVLDYNLPFPTTESKVFPKNVNIKTGKLALKPTIKTKTNIKPQLPINAKELETNKKQPKPLLKDIKKEKKTSSPGKGVLDFTCQASTLSQNILQSKNLKLLQQPKEPSQKNTFVKISDKHVPINKSVKFVPQKTEDKCENLKKQRIHNHFKKDGYSLAYDEKILKGQTTQEQY